jgi:hypothetical protein
MPESVSDIVTHRNRLEKSRFTADLVHSLGFSEALGSLQQHSERIENKLKAFLSAQEARETAVRVHNLALDIDEEIGRILKDPLVGRLYEYDGQFFTARSIRLFHTAFDGLHLLQSLSDSSLEAFFRGREKHGAIQRMLEELSKHVWVARVRRMNWEEFQTLGLVPQEVLDAIIQDTREHRREAETDSPRLSPEEQVFFQSFEAQMEKQG